MSQNAVNTTTKIDTELKLEIKIETETIMKITASKNKSAQFQNNQMNNFEKKEDCERNELGEMDSIENGKTRDQIKAEREARKQAKQTKKVKSNFVPSAESKLISESKDDKPNNITQSKGESEIMSANPNLLTEKKKTTLTKAERRAIQETQRAAKAIKNQADKIKSKQESKKSDLRPNGSQAQSVERFSPTKMSADLKSARFNEGYIKLFSHLQRSNSDVNLFVNNVQIHPYVARLGEQYARRTVVGSNARCIAFLNAMKKMIKDFETPPKKEFCRSLESSMKYCEDYLQQCRALSVSVINAQKNLKQVLMHLATDQPDSELKSKLCSFIDTYIENQIVKAAQAINSMLQKKISNGDVLLTFACSSLINFILEEAKRRDVSFRVIIVDSRPFCEGQELLRRLTAKGISCTYVLINAVSFVMPEVTKVLLGAHALLANGYVMARTGTAQIALVAHSYNVPVLVCCETHKFSERFQTDAIVYNELGNPDDLVVDEKCCLKNWQTKYKITPLNLNYDITPPELVTAVVTEVAILPCTSVPVILRMKPDWLVYAH